MLETGECAELLDAEPKEASVVFKAALRDETRVMVARMVPNKVTLLSYYFKPKPVDAPPRRREAGYAGERRAFLEELAEQFASDVETLLGEQAGREMRTKGRATVTDASTLENSATLQSLVSIVCKIARQLRDA